jgi:hypothetical protein
VTEGGAVLTEHDHRIPVPVRASHHNPVPTNPANEG